MSKEIERKVISKWKKKPLVEVVYHILKGEGKNTYIKSVTRHEHKDNTEIPKDL